MVDTQLLQDYAKGNVVPTPVRSHPLGLFGLLTSHPGRRDPSDVGEQGPQHACLKCSERELLFFD
jgi:hypothetical protein